MLEVRDAQSRCVGAQSDSHLSDRARIVINHESHFQTNPTAKKPPFPVPNEPVTLLLSTMGFDGETPARS